MKTLVNIAVNRNIGYCGVYLKQVVSTTSLQTELDDSCFRGLVKCVINIYIVHVGLWCVLLLWVIPLLT